ncbi:tetratricopeptide repeat protein [Brumimicrobium salinarum]|nr:tetratricopeptide repeat protein [Brumimicrobium salinarum]
MKQLLTFLFAFAVLSFGEMKAQENIDTYLESYETANVDHKLKLFFHFYSKLNTIDKDTILYYINDLQREGVKNKREDVIAMTNFGLAPYLQNNSLFDEASTRLKSAVKYYKKVQNDTMLSNCYNVLGSIYFLSGNIDKAETYFNESYRYGVIAGAERFQMLPIFNLARIKLERGDFEEAKKDLERYISYLKREKGMTRKLASAFALMGQLYLNQQEYDKALVNFTTSMEHSLTVGVLKTVANGYTNLAIVEFYSENYERSEQYFQLALSYRIKDNDKYYIAEGYYNLGDYYMGVNLMDSALINYQRSLKVGEEFGNLVVQKDALLQISNVYETLGNTDLQIATLKEIIKLQDELKKEQKSKDLMALKVSHDQSLTEVLNNGDIREEELKSQVVRYNAIFNNWLIVGGFILLGSIVIVFLLLRKRNN